ncbi:phosphotransferase [Parasphingorhabdus litoris]|uniref:Phosphotransferase n=1 Tax=Parasphingorhabdus litoris TaxID=394733 RepID=A0ABN1AUI0_9SPHN|nr:ecdysteroid 22-kinase family protein [Parasphingorhabdus litoris]
MSAAFPLRPEEFDPRWVEEIFGAPSGSLQSMTHKPVGTGQVCDSFRFTCDWQEDRYPASFVAKCPSADPVSRGAAAIFHLYDMEVGWYRDVAGKSGVGCPGCYHAAIGEDETQFVLMLEDMAPASQGDQLAGATLTQVQSTIREAAKLHSYRPQTGTLEQYSWLLHGQGNGDYMRQSLPAIYPQFCERFDGRLSTDILDMGSELIAKFGTYLDAEPAHPCITHSDMRLDNILFDEGGERAILVDWQTATLGNGANDIAYLIGTSFADPAERAAVEKDLIADYLSQLSAHGVDQDADAFWQDYRRLAFSGFIMAINASIHVEQTERGDEMFAVMAERPAQMALDLESLSLL